MNRQPPFRPAILLLLVCLGPALCATPPPVVAEDSVILPKFEVKGNPVCCYGFGIIATWNKQTRSIGHIYIDEISPGSDADKLGLQRGDEILALNGRKIADMKGGVNRGSDLFALLVDQPVGRTIDVEVAVRVVKKVVLTATP